MNGKMTMNGEKVRILKEVVYLKALTRHSPGETDVTYEKTQVVTRPRFEPARQNAFLIPRLQIHLDIL
jgi:hypothetical protein